MQLERVHRRKRWWLSLAESFSSDSSLATSVEGFGGAGSNPSRLCVTAKEGLEPEQVHHGA